jgi:hypothetical protein
LRLGDEEGVPSVSTRKQPPCHRTRRVEEVQPDGRASSRYSWKLKFPLFDWYAVEDGKGGEEDLPGIGTV